ncbi:fibronectin type III [Catenovulum agarivorans DS-2]|uniref:Fibronectin type III n=1 Tax=Catenovulum agarivorans DS-2 TaxID=1328313 RepID=W7QBR8_9ALTE|nr:GNA1162 family protein [Catenovulum agarivorans]EWH10289.1 fibronectin type III [Catenovulum agarivorans DS-2]
MKHVRQVSLSILLPLFFLFGCAVSNEDAVLVNAPLNQIENLLEEDKEQVSLAQSKLPKTLAILPFENRTESAGAFEIVRRVIFNHVSSKNYHMLHWQAVDDKLRIASIPLDTAYQMDAASLADILEVDAVLYGSITDFERLFAGVITQIKVGVELTLINRNGEVLWQESDSATSRAGGASVTPVGLLLNAALATMHLKEENLLRAADDVGRELARVMPHPPRLTTKAGPEIKAVVHNGMNKILKYGDILEVGIQGQAGMRAQAVIDGVGSFDLQEVEPGEYIGKIPVSKKANADAVVVEGVLMDENSNISRWISPFGLLTIDNLPPKTPQNLQASSHDQLLKLMWQNTDSDVAEYQVYLLDAINNQKQLVRKTTRKQIEIAGLSNFVEYELEVVAIDAVGNLSEPALINAKPLPDLRFNTLPALESNLPSKIEQPMTMTLANSPYYLRQPMLVSESSALLIEPGVEIIVSKNAHLQIFGQFYVYGDVSRPVVVKGAQTSGFVQFASLQSNKTVELKHLHVKGADVALTIQAGKPHISQCEFVGNRFSALDISGTANVWVEQSKIQGSNTAGVIVSGHAQVTFKQTSFADNQPFHIQSSSIYPVDAKGNFWSPAASQATVLGEVNY